MKTYSSLTLRGQTRRLRLLAFNALPFYNLDVQHLSLVTNDLNGIFRIVTSSGEKYILRVTLPEGGHTLDHVTAEMDWLAALARDTDIRVPRPLPARDGSLVVEAGAPGIPEPRLCVIFSWVPGKDLAGEMSEANVFKMGELMAGLHAHAFTYRPPAGLCLLRFDRIYPFLDPLVLFEETHSALFTPERRATYEKAAAWAQDSIDLLKASAEPMCVIHGDLHQWNVRCRRGVLSPIDFEDLMLGWPVQDIATTFYYFEADGFSGLRTAFREGYSAHRPWPERRTGEIDSFVAARGVGLVNLVLNDPNPAWKIKAEEFVERIERRLQKLMHLTS
jgi:Ser/Thr protein kinase RdoA (MazF antagonist)